MAATSPRLTRTESQQRTRERLLDAASRVFRERGYRAASVEEIAAEAGFTVGALYSNFKGKDYLLLDLLEREIGPVAQRITAAAGRSDDPGEMIRLGSREWIAWLDEDGELYRLLIEFWTIWVRDPELRPLHAERFDAMRGALGAFIATKAAERGRRLTLPPDQIGAAIVGLADGLAIQRLADPGAVRDELLESVLGVLIGAFTEPESS